MTVNSSRNALKRRTWALFMFFFLPGLLMASWATRTPAIRDILSVSIAEMGGVLFGLSIGSMSGILCSAWLVKRFGTRNVILVTMSCALVGMMILSLALWLTSPLLFAVGLGVFGASFGSAEVAINVEGAAVEREMNKTVLPMMHGFYSLGTLAGAVRGAGRCFLFFCRRLTHGEQDAVFPLGQLFGGRPVAFLLGHFGEVLDGDLVVHEHFDFACAI